MLKTFFIVFVTLASLILLFSIDTGDFYLIEDKSGGKLIYRNGETYRGYNSVLSVKLIYLECKGPGYSLAKRKKHTKPPKLKLYEIEALDYAKEQIAAGITTGETTFDGNINVVWKINGDNNSEPQIEVWKEDPSIAGKN